MQCGTLIVLIRKEDHGRGREKPNLRGRGESRPACRVFGKLEVFKQICFQGREQRMRTADGGRFVNSDAGNDFG